MNTPVSLQINLSPGDYKYARLILPHQLKCLADQVEELILTIDTKRSKGHFSKNWDENETGLYRYLHEEIEPLYPVKIKPVDYSKGVKAEVAEYFFGSNQIPDKDFRGGPFYAYFFGLFTATNNMVFHLDADIFLGGRSKTWIHEATTFFKQDTKCLFVSPLPGPPHKDDILISQSIKNKIAPYTYELNGMSTRIYMTDKAKLHLHKLTLRKPPLRGQIKSLFEGNDNADLPEHMFKNLLEKNGFKRIDFLGEGKGLWSLHPPYHSQLFYDTLPAIITNIETNNLPVNQYGFYDVVNEVCDWTEDEIKLRNNRWWKKLYAGSFK